MKIKSLIYLSEDRQIPLAFTKPICFLRGRTANELMDQMRALLAARHHKPCGDFLLRGTVALDGKEYEVVCLCTDKDAHPRIAANLNQLRDTARRDTEEYLRGCRTPCSSSENALVGKAVVESVVDRRPIFIYNYFDRLDAAKDVAPILDRLASLGRQVFIGVCPGYPDVDHKSVQTCSLDEI